MTGNAPTHTCSYFCDKPECIKAQRDELREKLAALKSQPVPVEPMSRYDAGLPNAYGGGNIEWWQDYIRAELGRAEEFYQQQFDALQSALQVAQQRGDEYRDNGQRLLEAADGWKLRAEQAESRNKRLVELLNNPSEAMLEAGLNASPICIKEFFKNGNQTGVTKSASNFECGEIFKAMSAELLREVGK